MGSRRERSLAGGGEPRAGPRGACHGLGAQRVTAIYGSYYGALVRQAALLVHDRATAEDVVQDVFTALQRSQPGLHDNGKSLAYLRRGVTNRAVSVLRHRRVVDRHAQTAAPPAPSAEDDALARLERSLVTAALHTLAPRQRQVLMLRYYAGLTEAQIAATLGISQGSVKAHSARARASLRTALQAVM